MPAALGDGRRAKPSPISHRSFTVMVEGSSELSLERCSACGQPYTAHAADCPHLLAVKNEHRQWADKAEGQTDEFRQEVEQKGADAVLNEQMESIAESHHEPVSEKIEESDEEEWPFEKAPDKLKQLDELMEWAKEALNDCKGTKNEDEARGEFNECGKLFDLANHVFLNLREISGSGKQISESTLGSFRYYVAEASKALDQFISKFEKK